MRTIVPVIAVLLATSACGKAESQAEPEKSAGSPAAQGTAPTSVEQKTSTTTAGEWKSRTSESGGFTITAPTDGISTESQTQTPAGPAKTVSTLFQTEGSPGALMVMYMDMPVPPGTPLAVSRGLEDGRDRAVRHYSGTLTSDRELEVSGYPAREFEFDATLPNLGAAKALMRGVFRDNRVYMIAGISKVGADDFHARAAEFVRSFTVLPPDAAGKTAH